MSKESVQSNYSKYRGKCKEYCEKAVINDPTLTMVRGHYYDPIWNTEEQHWWTVTSDGVIYDPTVKQFPSNGAGVYTEFDGNITCEECGKIVKEEDAHGSGNFMVCSTSCGLRLVGL